MNTIENFFIVNDFHVYCQMDINKNWMNVRGIFLSEYRKDVRDFIEFARHKADSTSRIKCPCKRCVNMVYHHIILFEEHLLHYGMDKKYTCQIWHGEGDPNEVVRDDDDTKDDSDVAKPVEYWWYRRTIG